MFGYNKYIVYGVLALIATAVITTYVLMWKHSIRQQALLEFNNKQLEQVVKDQQTFIKNMQEIQSLQKKTIDDINIKNAELQSKLNGIETYLDSDAAVNDSKESSDVLKKTIQELSRIK